MILVLAGTQDGRELALALAEENYEITASVVSDYGKQLYANGSIQVNDQPLDLEALKAFAIQRAVTAIVDASHPYAVNASTNAMRVCEALDLTYIRYERERTALPAYARLYPVEDYAAAARRAASLGKRVFLTTGSRNLKAFTEEPLLKDHALIARVLPDAEVIADCTRLGFTPKTLIALQGPFSHALNKELYIKYAADVIVMKNSGDVGGTDTKITAAIALGLAIVMIDRPRIAYKNVANRYHEVLSLLKEQNCR